jgi:hypothetical protein
MTDKLEDIVDNLKQTSHWVRVPFMLVSIFCSCSYCNDDGANNFRPDNRRKQS